MRYLVVIAPGTLKPFWVAETDEGDRRPATKAEVENYFRSLQESVASHFSRVIATIENDPDWKPPNTSRWNAVVAVKNGWFKDVSLSQGELSVLAATDQRDRNSRKTLGKAQAASEPPEEWKTLLSKRESALLRELWGGRSVTFDSLHQTVWTDKFVEDGAITKCISRANEKIDFTGWRILHKERVARLIDKNQTEL